MLEQVQLEIIVIVYTRQLVQDNFYQAKRRNPYIGESGGKLQEVEEDRIETIFPDYLEKSVLQAMMKAHPYEEVAYDIYPLENKGETLGLGRIGRVEEITLGEFANKIKEALMFQLFEL